MEQNAWQQWQWPWHWQWQYYSSGALSSNGPKEENREHKKEYGPRKKEDKNEEMISSTQKNGWGRNRERKECVDFFMPVSECSSGVQKIPSDVGNSRHTRTHTHTRTTYTNTSLSVSLPPTWKIVGGVMGEVASKNTNSGNRNDDDDDDHSRRWRWGQWWRR